MKQVLLSLTLVLLFVAVAYGTRFAIERVDHTHWSTRRHLVERSKHARPNQSVA